MKYRLIEAEKAEHSISRLCKVVGVTRQGFHAWRRRGPSLRSLGDAELKRLIVQIYDGSHQTYGAVRIHGELRDDRDVRVGRKRVARLMRELQIKGVPCRAGKRRTTIPDPKAPPAPDLVERRFAAERPNRLWLADITYVPTLEGFLFLGVVMDMYSRKIVGWSMRDDLKADLVVDALAMALTRRQPPAGLVHHSDRGSQGGFNWSSQHLARVRQDAARVGPGRLDGLARRRLRQRRLRKLHLHPQAGVDQAAPLPEPRPGPALAVPVHRDVLQPAPAPLVNRRHQPRRTRAAFPKRTTTTGA
jgi:transposase InsO family protein